MRYDLFVDGGFFRTCAARAQQAVQRTRVAPSRVSVDARRLRRCARDLQATFPALRGETLGQIRFYEGRHLPSHPRREVLERERRYFDALAHHGLVVCCGRLVPTRVDVKGPLRGALLEVAHQLDIDPGDLQARVQARLDAHHEADPLMRQKGVDTALALDLLARAVESEYDTAILITGDGDLAPAARHVRRLRKRVVLLAPPRARRNTIARDLERAVDEILELDSATFAPLYRCR